MAQIFILAGAPAVGKSTTARALAAQFEKSIHISVDNIRDMVVSGLILPSGNWSQGLIEQLSLARESVAQMALTYHKAGFVVVIDDFWDPNSQLLEYSHLFQKSKVHKVLLFPSQQTAEERNLKRSGSEYIAEGIRTVYEKLKADVVNLEQQGWIIADSTDKTVEATVRHILEQVG
jgi:predicted kinase